MKCITLNFIFVLLLTVAIPVLAEDGIPGNCETSMAVDVRNLIPRFEENHSRLVLVDWRTGDTRRVIGEGLRGYSIRSWSPDCRYLAIAEGDWRVTDTVVYDVENSVRMGSVRDATIKLHRLTWGPDGYLIVESRHGAILWHVPSGRQSLLTQSFNVTRVRNFVQIVWDLPHNQVLVTLAMGGRAAFDLGTGSQIPMTDEANALLDAGEVDVIPVRESNIRVDLRYGEAGTFGDQSAIIVEITNRAAYDLIGQLRVSIEVPVDIGISEIRIDPAQNYTDIYEEANSVREDGEMRTLNLLEPNSSLKIERTLNNEGETVIRLSWVSMEETLPAGEDASLQIDLAIIPVLSVNNSSFSVKASAYMLSRVP